MNIVRAGVDLAKNFFQVHGVDRNEKPVWKRKLKREEWLNVLLEKITPGCEIAMEACGGATTGRVDLKQRDMLLS